MVKAKNNNKKMVIIITSVVGAALLVLIVVALVAAGALYESYRTVHRNEALKLGLQKARDQCVNEDVGTGVCDNLKAYVADIEYEGRSAWGVYVNAVDSKQFSSTTVIVHDGGKYVVRAQNRNQ